MDDNQRKYFLFFVTLGKIEVTYLTEERLNENRTTVF